MDNVSIFSSLSPGYPSSASNGTLPFSGSAIPAIIVFCSGCSSHLASPDTLQIMRYSVGIFGTYCTPDFVNIPWFLLITRLLMHELGIVNTGNVVNLLLYTTPILTFTRVIKNKSTEEFSVIPYVAGLLNSFLYTLYGSPLASRGWENLPVVTINGTGVLMEIAFIAIYFWFATPRKKIYVSFIMAPVIVFCSTMVALSTLLHDHSLRRTLLGSFGFVASVSMYGSPLVAVRRVIETKSVEYMPLNLSLFSFLTSSAWMAYGLLGKDILLASPNILGIPLGILQLVVYSIYRGNKGRAEDPNKFDLEKNEESDLTTPLIVNEDSRS